MVSALFCSVPEHLHRAAGPQSRNHRVGLITHISTEIWAKSALPSTRIGAARSTLCHFCTNSCPGPSPALSNRSGAASCSFPGSQPLSGWLKTNLLLSCWGLEEKGWCVHNSVNCVSIILWLTPEPSPCLQHLLPPDVDREFSTQTQNILCNLQPVMWGKHSGRAWSFLSRIFKGCRDDFKDLSGVLLIYFMLSARCSLVWEVNWETLSILKLKPLLNKRQVRLKFLTASPSLIFFLIMWLFPPINRTQSLSLALSSPRIHIPVV